MRVVRSLARALAEPLQQERIETHMPGILPTYATQSVQMTIKFSSGDRLLVVSDSLAQAREFCLLGPDLLVTNKKD